MRGIRSELFAFEEQIIAARDTLARLETEAPADEIAMESGAQAMADLEAPEEPIPETAPTPGRLIIEARVEPNDIGFVPEGLAVQVKFTAFSLRHSLPVEGKVLSVSADPLNDETTGESFYLARVVLSDEALSSLEDTPVSPGMRADVMIFSGERTAFDYLLSPIARILSRAFREN